MKPNHFDYMAEIEQADAIQENGVLVGKRQEGFNRILLYQVDGLYAEIFYHVHFNVITGIHTFSDTNLLEPYLTSIRIDSLLHN